MYRQDLLRMSLRDWLRNWKTSVTSLGPYMECEVLCSIQLFARKVQVSYEEGLLVYRE